MMGEIFTMMYNTNEKIILTYVSPCYFNLIPFLMDKIVRTKYGIITV